MDIMCSVQKLGFVYLFVLACYKLKSAKINCSKYGFVRCVLIIYRCLTGLLEIAILGNWAFIGYLDSGISLFTAF